MVDLAWPLVEQSATGHQVDELYQCRLAMSRWIFKSRYAMQFSRVGEIVIRMMRGVKRKIVGPAWGADRDGTAVKIREIKLERDDDSSSALLEESGLFDRNWYLSTYGDVASQGVEPLEHYISHGWREGRLPSAFFDSRWYLYHYKDVAQASVEPLRHYLDHGMVEGRMPNPFFDGDWYETTLNRSPEEGNLTPYATYLDRGLPSGHAPLPELQPIYWSRRDVQGDPYQQYKRLVAVLRPWWDRFGRGKLAILAALFNPYEDSPLLSDAGDDSVEKFITFLEYAWTRNSDPGPLFQGAHYERVLWRHGLAPQAGETLLQHYLREGFDLRLVPTAHFDENAYYRQNVDIRPSVCWGFEHFIRWGVFEGRRASSAPRPVVAHLAVQIDDREMRINNWKYFLSSCGKPLKLDGPYKGVAHYAMIINEIFRSSIFSETMRRAALIDPSIGDPSDIGEVLVPPFHDARDIARRSLRERLPRNHYDTIVCVPWVRTGGADLVACQISSAICTAREGESLLIIRTDRPNFERPEWVPKGVDVIDASDIFSSVRPLDAQMLLYGMFMGLAPARVVNVNSRLCWDTLARFGSRLSNSMHLYSYLFCWDHTPRGYRVGYPGEFFPETAFHLSAIFTDTIYLKSELISIYRPPKHVQDRILPIFSPSRSEISGPAIAEVSVDRAISRRRWKVLWAGRLDRQKRFDLVQEIARGMPDIDFFCWGAALLDAPPDHEKTPINLELHAGFSSYDELPLKDADLWLFTSEWEGMPTLLIELAHRGMSIVASSVGGVPELIDKKTGWPVNEVRSVEAYVSAIREALSAPRERVARAIRLRERARARHSMVSYVKQISEVLNKEGEV